MVTSIQVQEKTLELLKKLRAQHHVKTYDDVIHKLAARPRISFYGILKKEGMKNVMKGLRDKHDRI
ncbi:hypothetical protein CMO91_02500 [Candidatus Woesearchaeota archaeon]|nr:hypothetical protein [Candidatus Woesearchaeota archaeon]|tara:strand:+ start:926 stop:1123 length:198 start_codon:yes stop_codon:yes gene_type:complete